jgi:hypothetical protein
MKMKLMNHKNTEVRKNALLDVILLFFDLQNRCKIKLSRIIKCQNVFFCFMHICQTMKKFVEVLHFCFLPKLGLNRKELKVVRANSKG